MGVARDGHHKLNYTPGIVLRSKYALIAKAPAVRWPRSLIGRFALAEARTAAKTSDWALKELWSCRRKKSAWARHAHDGLASGRLHRRWLVIYHYGENLASVGFVRPPRLRKSVSLSVPEFQRFQDAQDIRRCWMGGRRIAYGARAITRRWAPSGAQARFSRRRAHRLRRGLRQFAPHQG